MLRILSITAFVFYHLTAAARQGSGLRNGQWRAVLHRKDGSEIAFNFEVRDSAHQKILYIRNGGERLLVDDIKREGDSIWIRLPFFESQLRAVLTRDGRLEGVWLKRLVDNYQSIPFTAYYNEGFRFPAGKAPVADISGRWAAYFGDPAKGKPELLVGEFNQKGGLLTGTFLEKTGDYRFLEGVVEGDSLKLSCFDGGHAYQFTARIENDGRISGGMFFSGPVYRERWTAIKDANAKLPDEFSLTKWKKDDAHLNFSFRDLDGKMVSIGDERFRNKVVLIQIMGSWCPNCMDETRFLSSFYDQYRKKGVEIIGLAYERSTDFARSQNSLRSFQQRFGVKYPVLITGVSVNDSLRAEKTLPQLESIVGFPTTIFVDKNGNIQKIHTGFNGPGTGEHYEEQKKEFYEVVDGLLGE